MDNAAEILVIILSVFLALFLLLGIILTVILIKVSRQIKAVTASAQRTAEAIESTVSDVAKVTSPFFIARLMTRYVKKFMGHKK
jgi:hypothetical protein